MLQKKPDATFSKAVFHVQKHSGGAVKTGHVHAVNVTWPIKNATDLNVLRVKRHGPKVLTSYHERP